MDSDSDGQQDANETLTREVTVFAIKFPNILAQATTVNGVYTLNNLPADTSFDLYFDLPTGFTLGPRNLGNDATDNDFDVTSVAEATRAHLDFVRVADGATVDLDAGVVQGANLTIFSWRDADGDGLQDVGDPEATGLADVDVSLTQRGGVFYSATGLKSDSNGLVTFRNVRPGLFQLGFSHSTLDRTLKDQGGDDTTDSDADPVTGNTVNFTLTPGSTTTNIDAGFVDPGQVIGSDVADSDAGLTSGRTALFNVTNLANNLTIDAGLVPSASLTVTVKYDDNNDDVIVPGVNAPNIEVLVYDPRGGIPGSGNEVFVRKGKTNPSGIVTFTNLHPGSYYVCVLLPKGHGFSQANRTTNATTDSDIIYFCNGYGNTDILTLNPGQTGDVTAGLVPLRGKIEGTVWNDANRNKVRDAGLFQGDAPDIVLAIDISGSTSEPYAGTMIGDANGDGLAETILDAEILAGISLIQQLNTAGYGNIARIGIVTFDGTAHRIDMNGTQTGTVAFIKVNSNTDRDSSLDAIEALQAIRFGGATNYEAALKEAISIFSVMQLNNPSGFARERGTPRVRLYLDLDNDGILDTNEPSVLSLADDPDTTTIDESGTYRFNNILPGSYIVREVIPAGYRQTSPGLAGGLGWLAAVLGGKTIRNFDFGNAAKPDLSVLPTSVSYRAGTAGIILSGSAALSDADSPVLTGGFLSVRIKLNSQSTDRVFIWHRGTNAGQIGVSGSPVSYGGVVVGTWTGGSGATVLKITFNSKATIAAVTALCRRIAYKSTISSPLTSTRSLEWVLTDAFAGDSSTRTQTLTPVL